MKGIKFIIIMLLIFFATSSIAWAQYADTTKTQTQHPNVNFVDKNGDGYNDNAPDHDGDGIPNSLDPDWLNNKQKNRPAFRDLDGDGINDFFQNGGRGNKGFPHGRMPYIRDKNRGSHQPPFKQKMKGPK
ncbi:hypothetical protein ACX8XN_17640 [Calditrichota bacterium GD2]